MMGEEQFIANLTAGLPSRPPNIHRVVALNRHRGVIDPGEPPALDGRELRALLQAGATVLDSRMPESFDAAHLAGAINLPVSSPGVGTRAGWALDPTGPLVIIARSVADAHRMASALQAVGLWSLAGYGLADRDAWEAVGLPVAEAGAWNLDQLVDGLRGDAVALVDVREFNEWTTGHIRGSHHVPLHRLSDLGTAGLPPEDGRTTAVACAAGIRAAFAASLLRRAGRLDVVRVAGGGVPDLSARGLPLQVGQD
jgi:rhodanese-related sulfurtransferase